MLKARRQEGLHRISGVGIDNSQTQRIVGDVAAAVDVFLSDLSGMKTPEGVVGVE